MKRSVRVIPSNRIAGTGVESILVVNVEARTEFESKWREVRFCKLEVLVAVLYLG